MSNQNPSNPARRRRIAGERRLSTPETTITGGEPASPDFEPVETGARHEPIEAPVAPRIAKPAKTPISDKATQASGVPVLVLAVLALLAAVAVGLAAYFSVQASEAAAVEEAQAQAPAAAEQAAEAILSYNFETLEADKNKATRFLTDKYKTDYVDTFDSLVAQNAADVQAVVEAKVVASSVMLPGEDSGPDHQRVLVFVNQTTTSTANSEPQTALNRVVVDMRKGDDTWLVNGITSY